MRVVFTKGIGGKRKCRMKGCVKKQNVSDWQMHAWTLQTSDILRARWGMADDWELSLYTRQVDL